MAEEKKEIKKEEKIPEWVGYDQPVQFERRVANTSTKELYDTTEALAQLLNEVAELKELMKKIVSG